MTRSKCATNTCSNEPDPKDGSFCKDYLTAGNKRRREANKRKRARRKRRL